MTEQQHILVVEDDAATRDIVTRYLGDHDFRVSSAVDGQGMVGVLDSGVVDLIVLDLKLPDESGLSLARKLRSESDIPIIMLTGLGEEADRVIGLELGADDYVTKPFSPRELLARIRAVLRRVKASAPAHAKTDKRARYRFAGWELNVEGRHLTSPEGEKVALTNGEFTLLSCFLQSPGRVLSRDQLLELSRVHDDEVFDRSIDVQILRLRRKLEVDPRKPELIKTQRGAGYIFAPTVEVS